MDSTDNPLASLPPALANIIQLALSAFIDGNLPSIYIMIMASLWLGVSLCLFMTLLYSSRPDKRKSLLFVCCTVAVLFGTVPGILFLNLLIKSFTAVKDDTTNIAKAIRPYLFALSFFSFFSSICVDSILLLRLIPLLRLPQAPPKVMVLGPLILVKLGRIAVVIVFVIHYLKKSQTLTSGDPAILYTVVTQMPEPKVLWSLQLADNALCSFLFMFLLQRAISRILRSTSGYVQRLRALFLIAVSNFVFPVIFATVQLIFMTRSLSYFALAAINISGTNIEIIGVLFATIWASTGSDDSSVTSHKNSNATSSTGTGTGSGSGSGRRGSRVLDISRSGRQTTTFPSIRTPALSSTGGVVSIEMSSFDDRDDSPTIMSPGKYHDSEA